MKTLIIILLFLILLSVCWPVGLVLLIFLPLILLLSLFFKVFGLLLTAVLGLVTTILLLPFKLLGLG